MTFTYNLKFFVHFAIYLEYFFLAGNFPKIDEIFQEFCRLYEEFVYLRSRWFIASRERRPHSFLSLLIAFSWYPVANHMRSGDTNIPYIPCQKQWKKRQKKVKNKNKDKFIVETAIVYFDDIFFIYRDERNRERNVIGNNRKKIEMR